MLFLPLKDEEEEAAPFSMFQREDEEEAARRGKMENQHTSLRTL